MNRSFFPTPRRGGLEEERLLAQLNQRGRLSLGQVGRLATELEEGEEQPITGQTQVPATGTRKGQRQQQERPVVSDSRFNRDYAKAEKERAGRGG